MQKYIKRLLTFIFLFFFDFFSYYISLYISYLIRKNFLHLIFKDTPVFALKFKYLMSLWWAPIIFFIFLLYEKMYSKRYSLWDEVYKLIKISFLSTLLIFSYVSLAKIGNIISRSVFLFLLPSTIIVFSLFRYYGKNLLFIIGLWKENVIIVGAGNAGKKTLKGLIREKHLGFNVIGFLDDDEKKIGRYIILKDKKFPIFDKIKNYEKIKIKYNISTVFLSLPSIGVTKLSEIANRMNNSFDKVYIVPELKGITLLNTDFSYLFMEELFVINIKNNLKSPVNKFLKRLFDLIFSFILLMLSLPIIIIFAILIRIESRGSPFFINERWGQNGKKIKCIKLRSMYLDADRKLEDFLKTRPDLKEEWDRYKKLRTFDPRVTKIGKIIRKYSIDELPQLINVLLGDMSLVGPRPYLIREKNDMNEYFNKILKVKPGITGLWQISGRNEVEFKDRLKMDVWYILNWSLWLDIVILLKTIKVVFKREGAY